MDTIYINIYILGKTIDINDFQSEAHDHEADDSTIVAGQVFNEARTAVLADPSRPIKRSYDEAAAQHDNSEDSDDLPGFRQLRTRLQRVRAATLPPIPQDIDDVDIPAEWGRNWRGDRFLLHQDNDWGIALFATQSNLRILQQCDKVYIDGTFKTCPQPYFQFVTVHGRYLGQVFTLAMCLLTGKTIGHYRQLLNRLKRAVRNVTGRRWRPAMVICDFEQALVSAIETELPHSQVKGCYFHFCQSLWRKIQELGLANVYRRRRRVRKLLRKLMSIGHLPVALVRQNFTLLTRARSTRRLINRYPAIDDFIQYLANTYIRGTFPIAMWNVFDRRKDCRTNNVVEGLYSACRENLLGIPTGLFFRIKTVVIGTGTSKALISCFVSHLGIFISPKCFFFFFFFFDVLNANIPWQLYLLTIVC